MAKVLSLVALFAPLMLTGCGSDEKTVIVQPPPRSTVVVPPPGNTTKVCPAGETTC